MKSYFRFLVVILIVSIATIGCRKKENSQPTDWLHGLDGKFVYAFASGTVAIRVLDKNGERLVSNSVPGDYCIPSWSPDGSKIIFSVWQWYGGYADWYIMNSDGTGLTRITEHVVCFGDLSLSPDGNTFVFASNQYQAATTICTMNSDFTDVRQILNGSSPSWSPDGSKIYFVRYKNNATESSLFYCDLADTTIHELAELPVNSIFFGWSPKKTKVIYAISGEKGYYTMNPDGSATQRVGDLNVTGDWCSFMCWSPDDTRLAFTSSLGLFAVDLDGSDTIIVNKDCNAQGGDWHR